MPKRARTENVGEHDDTLAPLSTKQRKQLKRVVEHEMGEANIAFALGDLDASMKYVHSVSSVGTVPVGPHPRGVCSFRARCLGASNRPDCKT